MALSGWVIIDKPLGITSAKVGYALRRSLETKKIGHLGTLDPLATGVLTIAVGEATKAIPYYKNTPKIYEFEITWGTEMDTGDNEGRAIEISDARPSLSEIEGILDQFIGDIAQVPPIYSAIRINGKRSYKAARAGQDVSIPERIVTIHDLVIQDAVPGESCRFQVTCGGGTYVRSLGRDIARALGTVGYISALRRIRDGKFTSEDAIPLEKLQELPYKDIRRHIKPIRTVLDDIPAVPVSAFEVEKIRQGMKIESPADFSGLSVAICFEENFVAIATFLDGYLHPKRVFSLD